MEEQEPNMFDDLELKVDPRLGQEQAAPPAPVPQAPVPQAPAPTAQEPNLFDDLEAPLAAPEGPLPTGEPAAPPAAQEPAGTPPPLPTEAPRSGKTVPMSDPETGELIDVPIEIAQPGIEQEQAMVERSKKVADLPDPTQIFEGLSEEGANALYTAYAKHPKSTRDESGALFYEGKPVQAPGKSGATLAGEVIKESTSNLGGAGKGVVNAATNVAETALAGVDLYNEATGADKTYGIDTSKGLAQKFREQVPELKGNDETQQMFVDMGEIGAGALGGLGLGTAVGKGANLGKWGRALAKFIGGEGGTALTQSADAPLLVTGDKSLAEKFLNVSIPALGTDPNGNYSENILRKRFDLLSDALATGAAAGAVGAGVKTGVSFLSAATVEKIRNFVSLDKRKQSMVLDLLDTLAGNDPSKQLTKEEANVLREKAIALVEENTKFAKESGDAALGNIDVNRRTVHAAQEGGITPEALTQVQDMEGSVRQKSLGPLDKADAQVGNVLYEGTDTMLKKEGGEEVAGVPENMIRSKEVVQKAAREESAPLHEGAERAEQMAEGSERSIEEGLRTDPYIGERVSKIEDTGGDPVEEFTTRNRNLNKVNEALGEKGEEATKQLKAASDAIPDGLRMNNPTEIADKVQELGAKGYISKSLVDLIHNAQIKGAQGGLEYNALTPAIRQLRKEKDILFKRSPDNNAIASIQELDDLIKAGRPNAKEIDDWDKVYANVYAPINKSDVTGDLAKIDKEMKFDPAKRKAERKETISKAIESPDLTKQMSEVLGDPKVGTTKQHVLDQTLLDDVYDEVFNHVNAGGKLSEIDPKMLSKGLQKRMAQIAETNPKMAQDLSKRFKEIREGQADIAKFGEEAKAARKLQDTEDQRIFGEKFKDLFTGGGSGKPFHEVDNPITAFDDILTNPDKAKQLKSVVAAVNKSGDTQAQRGMRAAFIRKFNERIFDPSKQTKGAMDTKTGFASQRPSVKQVEAASFTKDDPLYQSGLEIFGEDRQALEYIQALVEEEAKSKKLMTNTGAAVAAQNKGLKAGSIQGVGRLITWTLGVLNPTATRAKTITSAAIDAMDPENKLRVFAEEILSDGENFVKEARKAMAKDKTTIPPEVKRYIRKTMVKAGIRVPLEDDEEYNLNQRANKAEGNYRQEQKKKGIANSGKL